MGLDITSYCNARPVTPDIQAKIDTAEEPRDTAYELGVVIPYINPDFAERAEGIRLNPRS